MTALPGVKQVELGFTPFEHQRAMHRVRLRTRFVVMVWHRRAGKTVFSIMELMLAALVCTKERGRFAYIAPYLKQSKSVAWEYLKAFALKIPGTKVNESDLSVTFPNGAQVRLYGADNAEALRGIYLDGVVLDEVADFKPEVWGTILRPALADRLGWAVFIGTPKGVNLFSELFFRASTEPGWASDLRRASETGVISREELEAARREMTEAEFAQEFECDFHSAADDVLMRLFEVQAAQARVILPEQIEDSPKVLGVDVARYGGDRSVIFPRQGLVGFAPDVFRGASTMQTASNVAAVIDRWQPDATFIDVGGVGGGVIDRLLQMRYSVIPIDFGGRSTDRRFANKRAEMWWLAAEWVKQSGSLPESTELQLDLTAPRYTYRNAKGLFALESKDEMRDRGLPSPDLGDAFVLTFAAPVASRSLAAKGYGRPQQVVFDNDPYAEA